MYGHSVCTGLRNHKRLDNIVDQIYIKQMCSDFYCDYFSSITFGFVATETIEEIDEDFKRKTSIVNLI